MVLRRSPHRHKIPHRLTLAKKQVTIHQEKPVREPWLLFFCGPYSAERWSSSEARTRKIMRTCRMMSRSQCPIFFANWRSIEVPLSAGLAHVEPKSHPESRLNWDPGKPPLRGFLSAHIPSLTAWATSFQDELQPFPETTR